MKMSFGVPDIFEHTLAAAASHAEATARWEATDAGAAVVAAPEAEEEGGREVAAAACRQIVADDGSGGYKIPQPLTLDYLDTRSGIYAPSAPLQIEDLLSEPS